MERGAVMMPNPIKQCYELIAGHLNEHQRRLWAGAEARVLGWGVSAKYRGQRACRVGSSLRAARN